MRSVPGHPFILLVAILAAAAPCLAAEVHSNTTGGGRWSSAETWHGGRVPSQEDSVVIAMGDVVVADVNDTDRPSCRDLYLDPTGVLTFPASEGSYGLRIDGEIDSYGLIRMDAARRPESRFALRIVAGPDRPSSFRLRHGAALLVHGAAALPPGNENVSIAAIPHPASGDESAPVAVSVTARGGAAIDLHRAMLSNVMIEARSIDNTGARPGEKVNIVGNWFTGRSRLTLRTCDTPLVRRNRFEAALRPQAGHAMLIEKCKLAQVHGNRVAGYVHGIMVEGGVDASVVGNEISDCTTALRLATRDVMVRDISAMRCPTGVYAEKTSGVIENTTIVRSQLAFHIDYSTTIQLTNCRVRDLPEKGVPMRVDQASVGLLNCHIPPDRIEASTDRRGPSKTARQVRAMHYLVVKVNGDVPANTQVDVRTAEVSGGVPKGRTDENVRNAPAFLNAEGLTLLPRTMRALVVRSWRMKRDGTIVTPPFYDLSVSVPGEDPHGPRTQLVSKLIEPDESWYRADLEDTTPTLEVTLP